MASSETEKYARINLILVQGGTLLTRTLLLKLIKDLSPPGQQLTLGEFLDKHKTKLLQQRTGRQYKRTLFPTNGSSNIHEWDLYLLCFILQEVFDLPYINKKDIEKLQTMRNKICHSSQPVLSTGVYEERLEKIKIIVDRTCKLIANESLEDEIKKLIHSFEKGPLSFEEIIKLYHENSKFESRLRDILTNQDTMLENDTKIIDNQADHSEKLDLLLGKVEDLARRLPPSTDVQPVEEIKLEIKNCTKETDNGMSQYLMGRFNEKISGKPFNKTGEYPDDVEEKLAGAVSKTFNDFSNQGRHLVEVKNKCLLLIIQCDTLSVYTKLIRDCLNGNVVDHLQDLLTAVTSVKGCENVIFEFVISEDKITETIDQLVNTLDTLVPKEDHKSHTELFKRDQTSQKEFEDSGAYSIQSFPLNIGLARPYHFSNSYSNQMVLCDDPESKTLTLNTVARARYGGSPFLRQNRTTLLHSSDVVSIWKDKNKVGVVKPVQRKAERQLSTGRMERDVQNRMPRSRSHDEYIQIWQRGANYKKFEGPVPEGVYLELPKDTTISEEFLILYFESRKSGGIEDTVIGAELSPSAHKVHAVVRISSDHAVESILRKRDHKLKGANIAVQPYYPEVHDRIIINASKNASQPHGEKSLELDIQEKEASNWKDPENAANVRLVQRKEKRLLSAESMEGDKQSRKPRSRSRYQKQVEDDDNLRSTVELILPSVKIVMLKICHIQDKYQEKYQTDSLRFVLNERTGKVIIRSSTDTEVVQAKLFIYECLSGLLMKEESLNENRLVLLKREQSKICLRNICKKQKIRASFVVNEANKSIEWYGFADGDIEQGVKLLQNEINVQQIQLRQGQERSVNGDAWKNLTQRLSVGTTCIFVDENSKTVIIESFYGPKVKVVISKIIEFLKENVPKKSASVTLEGAKARCFQTRMGDKMKREAVKHNGKLDIKEVSRSPLKLEIVVEGDEVLTDELRRIVCQIWHESIDFDKLSSKAEDKWLMLQGLGCNSGSMFFQNFEERHNCFIEVSMKEELFIPKPRVTSYYGVVNKESYDELTKQSECSFGLLSDDAESADTGFYDIDIEEESNVFEQYKLWNKDLTNTKSAIPEKQLSVRRLKRKQEFLLQGGMNDKEAILQSFSKLLQDQNTSEKELKTYEERYVSQTEDQYRPIPPTTRRQYTNEFSEDSDSDDAQQSALKTKSIQIGHINVTLVQGVLVKQTADVLVNVVSPTGSMTESVVSKSFLQSGGKSLKQLYEAALANNGGDGSVIRTGASGRLRCHAVLHVKLQPDCKQILGQSLREILDECRDNGYSSLALPPLGVGRMYKYPAADVAQCILQEISMYQRRGLNNSLRHVTVVIFKGDHKTYQDFDDAFTSFNTSGRDKTLLAPNFIVPYPAQYYVPLEFSSQQRQNDPYLRLFEKNLDGGQGQRSGPSYTPRGLQHIRSFPEAIASPGFSASFGSQHVSRKHHSMSNPADSYILRSGRPSDQRGSFGYDMRPRESAERDSIIFEQTQEAFYSRKHNISKSEKSRKSRFPDDLPVHDFEVIVFADNKDMCVNARNTLGKDIKKEFLYEEKLPKTQKISRETKIKIVDVVVRHCIKSLKDKDGYILKGKKENVKNAHRAILQILLEEKGNDQMRRRKRATVTRGTKEFAKVMYEDEPDVPSYWNMFTPDTSLKELSSFTNFVTGKKYKKVKLPQDSRPYSAIIKMINGTFDPSKIGQGQDAAGLDQCRYSKLFVLKIERIENPELFEKFAGQKRAFFRRLFLAGKGNFPEISKLPNCSGPVKTEGLVHSALDKDVHQELNEVFLFHGTKEENVKVICNSGFDHRLGSGMAMFGPGIYGAECSMKADQYTDDKSHRTSGKGQEKKMFLMRMLLGNAFLCSEQNPHKFRRPPCTHCLIDDCANSRHARKLGHLFDSIVGDNKKLFREFVVYDSALCYPEYLITYERR